MSSLEVMAKRVEPVVPLGARLGETVPRLAAAALGLDEAGVGEGREVLRHRLPRHRQLARQLRRRCRSALGEIADHLPPRRVG